MKENQSDPNRVENEEHEANVCLAAGAGIAGIGVGGALLLGAVCPLCYVAAPGFIAAGLIKKRRCKAKDKKDNRNEK